MFMLTRKLIYGLTIISNTKTQESHQSFLLILSLPLPTNIQIEQYCYSCTPRPVSLQNKWQADVQTGKQESEGLYSGTTYRGKTGCFFPYFTA